MFYFPDTFKRENEDYVTKLPLLKFARNHKNDYIRLNMNRGELINGITRYANESKSNQEEVNDWLDNIIREGKKDIYIQLLNLRDFDIINLKKTDYIKEKMSGLLPAIKHYAGNQYSNDLKICRYRYNESDNYITFYMCKMIYSIDSKGERSGQWYPIISDIYIDKSIIVTRVKPKSQMFEYRPLKEGEEWEKEKFVSITGEKEARKAVDFLARMLGINVMKHGYDTYKIFKRKLYSMLVDFTETPKEICDRLQEKEAEIEELTQMLERIAGVDDKYKEDILWDAKNMAEKYMSISIKDKSIFTKGRKAYPILMMATDEEESKLQQASSEESPLQAKAIFFDNKKMLQKNKACDGIVFSFETKDKTYTDERFNVRIIVNKYGCTLKLFDYTLEDDINEVLFTFINS